MFCRNGKGHVKPCEEPARAWREVVGAKGLVKTVVK